MLSTPLFPHSSFSILAASEIILQFFNNKIILEHDFLTLHLNVVIHLAFADTNHGADDNFEKVNDVILKNYEQRNWKYDRCYFVSQRQVLKLVKTG